jgi:hypothetical protein
MARAIAGLPDMQRDVPEQSISFFTKKLLNFSCLFRINQSIGSLKSSVEPSTSRMVDCGTSSEHKLNIVQNYRQKSISFFLVCGELPNLTYAVSLLRFLRSLTNKYTHKHTHTHPVGLIRTSDQLVAGTLPLQYTTNTKKRILLPAGFKPAIYTIERLQTSL